MSIYKYGTKARYKQMDKAAKLGNAALDTAVPHYDCKKKVWCLGEGADRREDVYLDRIIQELAGFTMKFRYTYNGQIVTRRVFAEILEDMVTRYDLSIDGFEDDYNVQQRKWLKLIRDRMRLLKNMKEGAKA